MTVRIVTDSTCDLPSQVISELNICVVPFYIHTGGRDYLDGIDITRAEFYQKLPVFKEHPTTAVPSQQKFRSIYEALAEEGAHEILSIHIASSLSAAVDIARTAAAETSSLPVTVVDSRQLSLGMGFLVQTAARLAAAGKSAAEILPALQNQIRRTHTWAVLDTLQYLKRSGRMNGVVSSIGEILQIKPILKMHDGISGVERIRTAGKAIHRLVDVLHQHGPWEKLAFLHSGALEKAQALRAEAARLLPEGETWFEVINPVLGAHLGPGVVGFSGVSREAAA